MDTDDVLKKFRESKFSPLLNGGDETSKDVLFLWPLVLQEDQELAQRTVILGLREGYIFQSSYNDLHTEWHDGR